MIQISCLTVIWRAGPLSLDICALSACTFETPSSVPSLPSASVSPLARPLLPKTRPSTAVLHNAKLIGLDEKGRLHAWSLEDGKFDADTSSKISLRDRYHAGDAG